MPRHKKPSLTLQDVLDGIEESHWEYDSIENLTPPFLGFIYVITRKSDGKFYVGSKYMTTTSTNWRRYTGSSEELNEDIKELGMDAFEFKILMSSPNRQSTSLMEATAQIYMDVLNEYIDGNCYNKAIANMKFVRPDQHSRETRRKLMDVLEKFTRER